MLEQDEGMYLLPIDGEMHLGDFETFYANLRARSEAKRLEDPADSRADFTGIPDDDIPFIRNSIFIAKVEY